MQKNRAQQRKENTYAHTLQAGRNETLFKNKMFRVEKNTHAHTEKDREETLAEVNLWINTRIERTWIKRYRMCIYGYWGVSSRKRMKEKHTTESTHVIVVVISPKAKLLQLFIAMIAVTSKWTANTRSIATQHGARCQRKWRHIFLNS